MKRTILMAVAACSLGAAGQASAVGGWRYTGTPDAVSTEQATAAAVESPAPNNENVPRNFMSKATVTTHFGEPDNQAPAVGQPPITRWYYPQYTVYFEHDRVITSVLN